MGTSFFKSKAPTIGGGSMGQEARAIGSSVYGNRGASIGMQKDLGAAQGINKAAIAAHGPLKRSAAYPKGPVT